MLKDQWSSRYPRWTACFFHIFHISHERYIDKHFLSPLNIIHNNIVCTHPVCNVYVLLIVRESHWYQSVVNILAWKVYRCPPPPHTHTLWIVLLFVPYTPKWSEVKWPSEARELTAWGLGAKPPLLPNGVQWQSPRECWDFSLLEAQKSVTLHTYSYNWARSTEGGGKISSIGRYQ